MIEKFDFVSDFLGRARSVISDSNEIIFFGRVYFVDVVAASEKIFVATRLGKIELTS